MKPPVSTAGVAAVVLAAAPLVLLYLAGWPTPTMPSDSQLRAWLHQPLTTGFLTTMLQTSAWLLWAMLATAIARRVHTAAAARLRWRIALRMPGPMQGLAAALLGATAVTSTALPAAAHTTATTDTTPDSPPGEDSLAPRSDADLSTSDRLDAGGTSPAHTSHSAGDNTGQEDAARRGTSISASAARAASGAPAATRLTDSHRDRAATGQTYTCVVERGDSLSKIAKEWLGDPNRWPEIFALNRGTHFRDVGGTLTNPNLIYPGWTLHLPDDATPPTTAQPRTPPAPTLPRTPNQTPSATPPSTSTATPDTAPPAPQSTAGPSTPATPDPDSVVERPPATPPSATATSPTSTHAPSSTTPTASPTSEDQPSDNSPGVSFPGGWVPVGLAAALAAAASMVWLRRRSRYNPTTDPDPANDPTLQPLPAVISRLRRAAREQAPDLVTPPAPQPTVRDIAEGTPPPPTPTGPSGPQLAGLPEHPADGLGLTGAGGPDAIRAMLVATLSSGSPDDPDARGHIVIPATALADLLDGNAITDLVGVIPRLHVTAGLDHALAHIEAQIIHRTRAVTDADVTNLDDLHQADPHHEPLPPIILITDVPDTAIRARLCTALHLGHPLGITAVIAGDWSHGTTLTVAPDGTTTDNDTQPGPKLAVLDSDTTLQLLTVLTEAHTGDPANPPPPSKSDQEQTAPAAGPGATTGLAALVTAETCTSQADIARQQPTDRAEPVKPAANRTQPKVRVRILGSPAIIGTDGTPVTGVRRASYELLTYLAVHRDGADITDIEVAMTPDATPRRARDRLSTNVANLRNRLTTAAGLTPGDNTHTFKPVVNPGGRYYLDPQLLDIDWWRVLDATSRAGRTTDRQAQREALEEAVSNWGGLLHHDFEWSDGPQHTCRQVGVNIHARLAVLVADTDPARARALLDAACTIDPINEQIARLAMTAHSQTGDTAAVRTRLTTLTQALQTIDEEPSEETHRLARRLLHSTSPRTDKRST
ncbi:LysM peptidoglycan-binding domain-containing protein [Micromonospora sp. C51]|uniref:BTAD domain-containing putative transcriptional regulator n=1 Tax=Micromonospora sp. C51 TaxID=2824879 RepID=UPI001B382D8A|nr:BTAD domain-containing putative transcriptional regulator [Micromonospora sp. C51]MBQ1052295.1 LysM peptidoglycan-binding domain-containing protein [Micromonospora sp. C51]